MTRPRRAVGPGTARLRGPSGMTKGVVAMGTRPEASSILVIPEGARERPAPGPTRRSATR